MLKETDGGGTSGEGSGERHDNCPHFTPPELSQQPSLRLNYSCKVEIKPPHTGSFSEFESVSHLMRHRTKLSMRIWSRPDPTGFHWDPPDVRLATDWVTVILHYHLSFFSFPQKRPALHLAVCMNLICSAYSLTLNTMHFLNKLYSQNQMKSASKPPSTNSLQRKRLWKALYDKVNSRTKFTEEGCPYYWFGNH